MVEDFHAEHIQVTWKAREMFLMPCKTVREWDPTIVIKVQSLAILTLNLTLEVLEIPKSPGFSAGACWHVASQWSNTCDRRGAMAAGVTAKGLRVVSAESHHCNREF